MALGHSSGMWIIAAVVLLIVILRCIKAAYCSRSKTQEEGNTDAAVGTSRGDDGLATVWVISPSLMDDNPPPSYETVCGGANEGSGGDCSAGGNFGGGDCSAGGDLGGGGCDSGGCD